MSCDEIIYLDPLPWKFDVKVIEAIWKDVEFNLSQLQIILDQSNDKKLISARIKQRMGC